MYTTLKPSDSGGIKEHILNLHRDEPDESTLYQKYERYVPSKEEVIKIVSLIERLTGLKASDELRNGDIKIQLTTSKTAAKKFMKEYLDSVDQSLAPVVRDLIKTQGQVMGEDTLATFSKDDHTVYMPCDYLDVAVKRLAKIFVELGIAPGRLERHLFRKSADAETTKSVEKFLIGNVLTHEFMHDITADNNPNIQKNISDDYSRAMQIFSEISKMTSCNNKKKLMKLVEEVNSDINSPKYPEKLRKLVAELASIDDRMTALRNYDESVSYYASYVVMHESGYKKEAEADFRHICLTLPEIEKGERFLEAVWKAKNKHPVQFTIQHPPLSMRHIEHPDEYLKDREEGRV